VARGLFRILAGVWRHMLPYLLSSAGTANHGSGRRAHDSS
jgi:hypothetical protein